MSGDPSTKQDSSLTGWQRISRLFSYAFARTDATAEIPPMPEEFKEWAQDTLVAMLAGLLFGGGKRWVEERQAGPPQPPQDAPTKLHAARAVAEANTQRMSRIANASVRGGLHFGGLAAVFYGVQMLSGVYRGRRDFLDAAHGGLAAGAAFGYSLHRSVKPAAPAARSVVLGAALGASLGIPFGLLQDKVVTLLPAEHQAARARRHQQMEQLIEQGAVEPERVREAAAARGYDVTAAVIQQLEASLSSSPTQQRQQQTAGQHGSQQQERQQQR
ncbi:hypothetical protein ABPG77_005189 [Micractinium sp. CCAP 211/92]